MSPTLEIYLFALGLAGLLGPFCVFMIVRAVPELWGRRLVDNLILVGIILALSISSYFCIKYALRLRKIIGLARGSKGDDLVLTPEGISIFIGVLINNNLVRSNRPDHRYFVSWKSVLTFEQFQSARTFSTVWVLRLYVGPEKHIDIPLSYFGEEKAIMNAINDFHGRYGPHAA